MAGLALSQLPPPPPTVTMADFEVVPVLSVQASVYVVVTLGLTTSVPEPAFAPVQPPEAVHEVAAGLVDQVNVLLCPVLIVEGVAVNVMTGPAVATVTVLLVAMEV